MSAAASTEVAWPGYRLTAVGGAPIREEADGTVVIQSEATYVLECDPPFDLPHWRGLRRLRGQTGLLQLINFIGIAELGEKRIRAESNRLKPGEVNRMLDEVVAHLAALVFTRGTPTSFAYERTASTPEEILYQAYVLIRHALRSVGPHDLPLAMNRILTRPHRQLIVVTGAKPLAEADRLDATSVTTLMSAPLVRVPLHSPLRRTPLVSALNGLAPTHIRSTRPIETTNTRENAFIAAVLALTADVVRRYAEAVLRREETGQAEALAETEQFADILARWQRHPVLASTKPRRTLSIESSVLRGRPGYRDVTRFFVDLQSRTQLLAQDDAARLLDSRDAALIYEYWCFFEVVAAVTAVTRAPQPRLRYAFGPFSASIGRSNGIDIGDATVWFNRQYVKRSYSVPLRPDISVELRDGSLHLFDAKFKHDPASWSGKDDDDSESETALTYRRSDLYKMHTYRDALGAESVWILYPGRGVDVQPYRPKSAPPEDVVGVGAIPLTPGEPAHRAHLRSLLEQILAAAN